MHAPRTVLAAIRNAADVGVARGALAVGPFFKNSRWADEVGNGLRRRKIDLAGGDEA
jgi:hypothetical protein